ncbi:DUF155-domain-containing protein [Venturia nashicola]|uniref:DUF155-domain-containing protein n=1 Tax=Venturia nashicola TaxID=86259 RepID=A0A4Z1P1K1_9PEZI|nr:DUF155-domain-containing protein [Venturia nashicola]
MWLRKASKSGLRTETRLLTRCVQRNHSQRHLSIPRSLKKKQDPLGRDDPPIEQSGRLKLPPRKTSLRRVGLEAERSRVVVRHRGGMRVLDPDVQTRITAYCAAEEYNISVAARLVEADGFDLDPYNTTLYPQVIHIQTPILPSGLVDPEPRYQEHGDLFIFPSGTVVAWNVPERIAVRLVERVLPPAAVNSHSGSLQMETEDLEYTVDTTKDRSEIIGDTIILGTKSKSRLALEQPSTPSPSPGDSSAWTETSLADIESPELSTVLAKIAFSSGLARSTKLAVLERLTEAYFDSTRTIPTILSQGTPLPITRPALLRKACETVGLGSRLPFSRPFMLRKTGELLSIRAQLNLYSELTDSLPDLFWDSKHELGLEDYYSHVGKALDVGVRIKVLNDKLDYAQEIASVLRETLIERHNLRLEWIIIILIAIEVVFELGRMYGHMKEDRDPESMERLMRRFLEKELAIGKENGEKK